MAVKCEMANDTFTSTRAALFTLECERNIANYKCVDEVTHTYLHIQYKSWNDLILFILNCNHIHI